jgi:hypothetical protein
MKYKNLDVVVSILTITNFYVNSDKTISFFALRQQLHDELQL